MVIQNIREKTCKYEKLTLLLYENYYFSFPFVNTYISTS